MSHPAITFPAGPGLAGSASGMDAWVPTKPLIAQLEPSRAALGGRAVAAITSTTTHPCPDRRAVLVVRSLTLIDNILGGWKHDEGASCLAALALASGVPGLWGQ